MDNSTHHVDLYDNARNTLGNSTAATATVRVSSLGVLPAGHESDPINNRNHSLPDNSFKNSVVFLKNIDTAIDACKSVPYATILRAEIDDGSDCWNIVCPLIDKVKDLIRNALLNLAPQHVYINSILLGLCDCNSFLSIYKALLSMDIPSMLSSYTPDLMSERTDSTFFNGISYPFQRIDDSIMAVNRLKRLKMDQNDVNNNSSSSSSGTPSVNNMTNPYLKRMAPDNFQLSADRQRVLSLEEKEPRRTGETWKERLAKYQENQPTTQSLHAPTKRKKSWKLLSMSTCNSTADTVIPASPPTVSSSSSSSSSSKLVCE